MGIKTKSAVAHVVQTLAKYAEWLACRIGSLQEARKRRIAQESEFYRNLTNHWRTNNLAAVIEDDRRNRR